MLLEVQYLGCIMFSDELEMVFLDMNFARIRVGGWRTHASRLQNVPLGMDVLVLVFSSFKLSGTDRSRQKLPFPTKLGTVDPLGIVLLLGSVYLMITLLVLIDTGLRPFSHNKYLRIFKSFDFSLKAILMNETSKVKSLLRI